MILRKLFFKTPLSSIREQMKKHKIIKYTFTKKKCWKLVTLPYLTTISFENKKKWKLWTLFLVVNSIINRDNKFSSFPPYFRFFGSRIFFKTSSFQWIECILLIKFDSITLKDSILNRFNLHLNFTSFSLTSFAWLPSSF